MLISLNHGSDTRTMDERRRDYLNEKSRKKHKATCDKNRRKRKNKNKCK